MTTPNKDPRAVKKDPSIADLQATMSEVASSLETIRAILTYGDIDLPRLQEALTMNINKLREKL